MKRILPILLGALAGAIGLPIVMAVFAKAGWYLFQHISAPPISIISGPYTTYQPFISSNSDLRVLIVGALLGFWSVDLWRSERTFWPRFKSAIGSAGVFVYFAWNIAANYRSWSLVTSSTSTLTPIWYLPAATSYLPLLLWALALFFFAVLTRRRTDSKPLLP